MIIGFPAKTNVRRANAPERRRVVVIGASEAGLAVAAQLGEHCLLLEQDGPGPIKSTQSAGLNSDERHAVASAGASPAGLEGGNVSYALWSPPDLQDIGPSAVGTHLDAFAPRPGCEVRYATRVIRIVPSAHRVELCNGDSIVYDKLISAIPAADLIWLLQPELPDRIRSQHGLMYWLTARDVELIDGTTQYLNGDPSAAAAGSRVAATVNRALAQKFRRAGDLHTRTERLFKPRIVDDPPISASS